jgi:hypothetical protein
MNVWTNIQKVIRKMKAIRGRLIIALIWMSQKAVVFSVFCLKMANKIHEKEA